MEGVFTVRCFGECRFRWYLFPVGIYMIPLHSLFFQSSLAPIESVLLPYTTFIETEILSEPESTLT